MLLEAHPWVTYRTYMDLLGRSEDDPRVAAARREMFAHLLLETAGRCAAARLGGIAVSVGLVPDFQALPL